MKFIHLTDPHISDSEPNRYGLDTGAALNEAVSHINSFHPDAAFTAITGDLTADGGPTAYEKVRQSISALRMPVHLGVGNHDARATLDQCLPGYLDTSDGYCQYAFEYGGNAFLMLDTLEPGWTAGRLCDQRLAWLDAALADHRGQQLCIFMHHPPFPVHMPSMDHVGLTNPNPFWKRLEEHGGVRCILFGHVHATVSGTRNGILYGGQRSTLYQFTPAVDPAGGPVASMAPAAYSVIYLDETGVTIHNEDYGAGARRFSLSD